MAARSVPDFQTAILQPEDVTPGGQSLTVSSTVPVPPLTSSHDVLVRVLAVALNPTDHKMPTHFPCPGNRVGCDFCGVIVQVGNEASTDGFMGPGTRVCGGLFPYGRPQHDVPDCGAFAQFVIADSRLLIRVPDTWSDLEGAVLGGIGWTTAALAISASDALGLPGLPSHPAPKLKNNQPTPVLVYGAATATGTMACQLLRLSGYAPIAIASKQSAGLAMVYGAQATAAYTSPTCAQDIKDALTTIGIVEPIRYAIDCITTRESAQLCFAALHRTGGRYACLEGLPDEWRTRRAVHVKEIMAFEGHGRDMIVDDPTYSRKASPVLFELCERWAVEVQNLVDAGRLKSHPLREVEGGSWDCVISGLAMLQKGGVRGEKLAVKIAFVE